MLGSVVRVLVLVLWIAVTGSYAVRHLGLGLAPPADAGAVLAGRLDRTLIYDLRWRPAPAESWQMAGSSRVGVRTEDVGLRTTTEISITNPRVIPGAKFIRHFLDAPGGRAAQDLRLRMDQLLDSRMRLQGIEVEGVIFGIAFSGRGPVDHNGLTLAWKAGGKSGSSTFAEVRPEVVASSELAAGLPAGLKPGARFSTRFASIDPARLRLATKEAVFSVLGRSRQPTAKGEAELLEVEMRVDDRRVAILWCDDAGQVLAQELSDQGLRLDLRRIDDAVGRQLWPVLAEERK